MGRILAYSDDGSLAEELCALTKAGHDMDLLAFDERSTDSLSKCGADKVILVENVEGTPVEAWGKSLACWIRQQGYDLVVMGATPRGRDLAARVAGCLDCGIGCDVRELSLEGTTTSYERFTYGGNVVSHESIEGLAVVTVAHGAFEPTGGDGDPADVETIELVPDARMKLISRTPIAHEGVDITTCERVVGVGMGLSDTGDLKLAEDLADALGGAVACSRGVAEERGWLPVERYVGISGKVISPKLYLTLGISGQVQHLYGARDARIIAAVDKNENAPIARSADYYIVGDLAQYAPLIEAAIEER